VLKITLHQPHFFGATGPEGSVLALPLFAVMFTLLWIVYRRRPARPT
jgi:hypothetical protein